MKVLRYAILAAACCAILMGSNTLQAQELEWARQFGTAADDSAFAVAVDGTGVYVVGWADGALPGQTSNGGVDALVRKYDADGNLVWTKQFGTAADDNAYAAAADGTGVYVAGYTLGALPGQTSSGAADVFVRKYDTNGTELWMKQFGTSAPDAGYAMAVDGMGVYVAGYTLGALPGQMSSGSWDAFVRKYDTSGNELWTRQFGTSEDDRVHGVAVGATGVYVTGVTSGALPGQTSSGAADVFVRKYDTNGNAVWTRQFGTATTDWDGGAAADVTGVYVTGYTAGALPGQMSGGSWDAFVRKYGGDGNEVWTRQFGTSAPDYGRAVAVDVTGVYVAGMTYGALPDQVSSGDADVFVRTYNADGNEVWTSQFGTAATDSDLGAAAHGTGVYLAGYTYGALPGQTSLGSSDAFLVKISLPDSTPPVFDAASLYLRLAEATSPEGAQVNYAKPTATDNSGEMPAVTCTPGSGSTFPTGSSTVECTATDASDNSATASFTVLVKAAAEQISDLRDLVASVNTVQGISNSLGSKLQNVAAALENANAGSRHACNQLGAFVNETLAQAGKKITQGQADLLVGDALRIKGAIGCP